MDPEAGSNVSSQDLPGFGERVPLEVGGALESALLGREEVKAVGGLGLPRSGSVWGP